MKCKNCNLDIDDDSVFCEHCGARVYEIKREPRQPMKIAFVVTAIIAVVLAAILIHVLLKDKTSDVTEQVEKIDMDDQSFQSCENVNDYRAYILNYGSAAKHYDAAKRKVEEYVADSIANAKKQQIQQDWVNLGLPSGTKWKDKNEEGVYTYDEAVSKFENKLPTTDQFNELIYFCEWTWNGDGYNVVGPNGNSIVLPASGCRGSDGSRVYSMGSGGFYWSCAANGSNKAWYLGFDFSGAKMYDSRRSFGRSVRLVKN